MYITKTLDTRRPQSVVLIELSSYHKSNHSEKVRCSNCGSFAERLFTKLTTKIECPKCDDWIETDTATGEVIGTSFSRYSH
jgi:ribosomal protein S27E